jgi:hypothetical protein
MTQRDKPKLTDDEINELVIAEADDPSAWGEPVIVGPSKGPRRARPAKHLELSSKFYVLSVLHRLGVDATMTFSQSDNVDITVVVESGHALTVDVKTLSGSADWVVTDFRARPRHFVAIVWYQQAAAPNVPPDVYIVGSEELRQFVASHGQRSVSLRALDDEIQARNAWQRLALFAAA